MSAQREAEQILRDLLKNETDEQQQLVRDMTKGLNSNQLADLLQKGLISGRIEVGKPGPAFLGDDGTAPGAAGSPKSGGAVALNDDAALIRLAGGSTNNENWT